MPELPEVETIRGGLVWVLRGRRVVALEVTGARTARRYGSAALQAALVGARILDVGRRGKHLLLPLDTGRVLVVHLRMSGQLRYVAEPGGVPPLPHTHVVARLEGGGELRFVDPRTFGEWYVSAALDDRGLPRELAGLGPDPLADAMTRAELARHLGRALEGRRAAVKSVLLDQRVLAGVGNLYADEICFRARLRPDRPGGGLRPAELRRLADATLVTLRAAVAARGSSLADRRYVDLDGEPGRFQAQHAVYGREGLPCPRCGGAVVRLRVAGRSAWLCPRCQR
jgi:formamidopyrimidine-DNA glycosylase